MNRNHIYFSFQKKTGNFIICLISLFWLLCCTKQIHSKATWKSVSFPDFFNFDVPQPWPEWDSSVDWFLDQVEGENPDYVMIAGDLVNGHWWDGPKCIEQMGALYYEGWIRRLKQHNLTYFTCIGDHELGDDPWPVEKVELVPHFERVFAMHMKMPGNGPENKKGTAYYVLHNNVLMITVETFEIQNNTIVPTVSGKQLEWFRRILVEQKNKVEFVVVQGHVPVFGPVDSRSSSAIMLENGRKNPFWEAMKEGGVDLYLCGEHHAVTVYESDGIWQIVHGSSWGRKVVNTMDYLVLTAFPEKLRIEMKSFPMHAKGDYMWNLHKDRGPREIVEIPEEIKNSGPKTIGEITIDKSAGIKQYINRTGIFQNSP
ncbi:metallophosphoesterase [bacterium]|nr:metallophosphoesterase [bacterium]